MDQVHLYSCYFTELRSLYWIVIVVSVFSFGYFLYRIGWDGSFFDFFLMIVFLGLSVALCVEFFDHFDPDNRSFMVEFFYFFSNFAVCLDNSDTTNYFYYDFDDDAKYGIYPHYTGRVVTVFVMLLLGFCALFCDTIRFIFKFLKWTLEDIALRVLICKERSKLSGIRSDEAVKLSLLKLEFKDLLLSEKNNVEKTRLQLAAQQQRIEVFWKNKSAEDKNQEKNNV